MKKEIVKKIICLLIIFEFLLSGLGFCGHNNRHNHIAIWMNTAHTHEFAGGEKFHFHLPTGNDSDSKSGHQDGKCHNYHCFCLGNFLAESNDYCVITYFSTDIFIQQTTPEYNFIYKRRIYRPPIA